MPREGYMSTTLTADALTELRVLSFALSAVNSKEVSPSEALVSAVREYRKNHGLENLLGSVPRGEV
jgi:hypothetical protein